VKIFVRERPESELEPSSLLDQLEKQQQQRQQQQQQQRQQQAPGLAPLPVEDTPTCGTGEGRDPPPLVAKEPSAPQEPVSVGRSQSDRRPLRYLADYHVGHLELPSQSVSAFSTDNYPRLVGNSF